MQLFTDVAGQDDNLGDSVLRRGLLEALRRPGLTLHIHTGDNSASYVSGLELQESDITYADRRNWRDALLRSVAKTQTSLAIDPGEIRSDAEMNFAGPRVIAAAAAVRARRGAVIHSGIGLRATDQPRDRGTRLLARLSTVTTWRDEPSRARGAYGSVAPDWAFSTGPLVPREGERPLLAISMRGDRTVPDERWVRFINDLTAATDLKPVIFAQVRRDNALVHWLAARVPGASVDLWPDEVNHQQREEQVRDLFSRSIAVVSDRVHALIMGATEGAVPLGLARNPEKLARTLAGAGIAGTTFATDSDSLTVDAAMAVIERSREIQSAVQSARRSLDQVKGRIGRQLVS